MTNALFYLANNQADLQAAIAQIDSEETSKAAVNFELKEER